MFPQAKKVKVDTTAFGAALTQSKHEFQAERGEAEPVTTIECCQYCMMVPPFFVKPEMFQSDFRSKNVVTRSALVTLLLREFQCRY